MSYRLLLLLLSSVLASACCREVYRFDDGVNVVLVEETEIIPGLDFVSDTIRGPFLYRARLSYRQLSGVPVVRPAQLFMAFSCDESYDVVLRDTTATVSLDRSFTFNGTIRPAGTDLISLLDGVAGTDSRAGGYPGSAELNFGQSFLDLASIPAGTYTFTFRGELEDGRIVEQSTPVYLDLP